METDEWKAVAIGIRRGESFNLWPPTDRDRRALGDAFLQQSASGLIAADWEMDPIVNPATGAAMPLGMLGAFRRAIGEGFAAQVLFNPASRRSPEDSAIVVRVSVSLAYLPLDRVMWLTTDRIARGVVRVRDVRDMAEPSAGPDLSISAPVDVDRVVANVVDLVETVALPWARDHASIDFVLEDWRSRKPEGDIAGREFIPALLAAAGRFDDARSELERYLRSGHEEVTTRSYRRFACQLVRFIDARGDVRDPSEPPRRLDERLRSIEHVSIGESWRDAMRVGRARDAAISAVSAKGRGKERKELRSMLAAELEARGLDESPLFVENSLDKIQDVDVTGGIGGWARAVRLVGEFVGTVRQEMKRGLTLPDWLEPPDRASYPMVDSTSHFVAARLEADGVALLDRVIESAPGRVDRTVKVVGWLDWATDRESDPGAIIVSIGAERVGRIDTRDTVKFRQVMVRAAERDELPWMSVRLTKLAASEDPYLLEVPLPVP
jgi:hypothetical protein